MIMRAGVRLHWNTLETTRTRYILLDARDPGRSIVNAVLEPNANQTIYVCLFTNISKCESK